MYVCIVECETQLLFRAYLQETRLGQKFLVNATLATDLRLAGQTDDLQHTVNYAQVYE